MGAAATLRAQWYGRWRRLTVPLAAELSQRPLGSSGCGSRIPVDPRFLPLAAESVEPHDILAQHLSLCIRRQWGQALADLVHDAE